MSHYRSNVCSPTKGTMLRRGSRSRHSVGNWNRSAGLLSFQPRWHESIPDRRGSRGPTQSCHLRFQSAVIRFPSEKEEQKLFLPVSSQVAGKKQNRKNRGGSTGWKFHLSRKSESINFWCSTAEERTRDDNSERKFAERQSHILRNVERTTSPLLSIFSTNLTNTSGKSGWEGEIILCMQLYPAPIFCAEQREDKSLHCELLPAPRYTWCSYSKLMASVSPESPGTKQGMDLIEPAAEVGGWFFGCSNCSYVVLLLRFWCISFRSLLLSVFHSCSTV